MYDVYRGTFFASGSAVASTVCRSSIAPSSGPARNRRTETLTCARDLLFHGRIARSSAPRSGIDGDGDADAPARTVAATASDALVVGPTFARRRSVAQFFCWFEKILRSAASARKTTRRNASSSASASASMESRDRAETAVWGRSPGEARARGAIAATSRPRRSSSPSPIEVDRVRYARRRARSIAIAIRSSSLVPDFLHPPHRASLVALETTRDATGGRDARCDA
jgi:hypothetical protein